MKLNITIPNEWNDLTTRQQKKIAVLLHSAISGVVFDYKLFKILMNVRWWQFFKYRKFLKVTRSALFEDLKEHYSWVYTDLSLTSFIPRLKKKYIAPADRLTNFTVDEFAHTEDLFLTWYKTNDFEALHYLAAILYRENNDLGKRAEFDKNELEKRAKLFSKLNKSTLLAIALSYQGCKLYITRKFPLIFPTESKKKSKKNKLPDTSGFGKLILHFSGQKFGTYNETKNTNLYTFLSDFEEQLKSKPYA
ncbi:hypothetical protein [Tenacibaculum singaporense]|uniref:hypothetical protein n=1 Tax=Tenacibaculum singaporense TaxID=2358479 RepID=UPI000F682F94|nr:hypothetical protein [Tenacibaculum singaporense]RSC96065.1 hypothetical protein EI424_02790 [Tenacibaculum singaporense]